MKTTGTTQSRISQGNPRYLGLTSKFYTPPVGHPRAAPKPAGRYVGGKQQALLSSTGNTALPPIASALCVTNDHTKPYRVFHLIHEPLPGKWDKPLVGLGEGEASQVLENSAF